MIAARRFRIACTPYASDVEIMVGPSSVASPWLVRHGDEALTCDDAGSCYAPEDGSTIRCWVGENGADATTVHELVHVAVAVLHRAGVPISEENDEALAYMVAHLWKVLQARLVRAPRPRKPKNPPPDAPSDLPV